jgi:type II secretory ATPase GspE/PulE/Tfp pilus assembly ATPase PilB-like protein
MTEAIAALVIDRAEGRVIERAALDAGMVSMQADGVAKAARGLTTIEEVLRVTREA